MASLHSPHLHSKTTHRLEARLHKTQPKCSKPEVPTGRPTPFYGSPSLPLGSGHAPSLLHSIDSVLNPPQRIPARNISLGRAVSCQHGAFSGVGAFVVSFVPAECPVGGGMWGIFGKPLKRAIRNTPGLHAVLTTCLRFFSALDSACVACCLFLLTGSHHVFIQIHTTCCCFP